MKILFKILKYAFLIFIVIVLYSYYHVRTCWRSFVSEKRIQEIVEEIKNAQELPDLFYCLYQQDKPNSLEYGMDKHIFNDIFLMKYSTPVSLNVSKHIGHYIKDINEPKKQRRDYLFYPYSLTWKLEKYTTQKECLNWLARNDNFVYDNIGVEQASLFFYHKTLEELDTIQMASLVVMMRNPALYNPVRRAELVKSKSLILVDKLNNDKPNQTNN
ncbi:transglycosylase domain-containing protein [Labilibacter marinus]|uniref:transglycosylase domain-containing protein n=1 Tax=Labilibacter marinus TaxID=1477105 RepID=UPI0008336A73|nr:transglycosylase domain-containing protein [Labilibacter marinus]